MILMRTDEDKDKDKNKDHHYMQLLTISRRVGNAPSGERGQTDRHRQTERHSNINMKLLHRRYIQISYDGEGSLYFCLCIFGLRVICHR